MMPILDDKLVKMLGFCQNSISGQKFDLSNSVVKNWTPVKVQTQALIKEKNNLEKRDKFYFSHYIYQQFYIIMRRYIFLLCSKFCTLYRKIDATKKKKL